MMEVVVTTGLLEL